MVLGSLKYEATTYGGVVRVRAPHIRNRGGFEQRGDLFVPQKFATQNWWNRNPVVDISVKNGEVSIHLTNPESYAPLISYSIPYSNEKYSSLDEIVKRSEKYISHNYNRKDKYR